MAGRQTTVIGQMTDKEILFHLYITQIILIAISCIAGFFLFSSKEEFYLIWQWDIKEIILYGGSAAAIVIIIDGILMKVLPKEMYDDGGINEKVFQNRSIWHIFFLSLLIAFAEEVLFRGVIQTHFGYVAASIIFALLHVRYLSKWVLLIVVLGISFFLGWIYLKTNNLWVTIFAHFLIDFVFALIIRIQYLKRGNEDCEEGDQVEE